MDEVSSRCRELVFDGSVDSEERVTERMRSLGTTMMLYRHPQARIPLYRHQCALLDAWEQKDAFILATKTGSGKTAASVLPVICHRESAVFVYPTNALIANQERSILTILEKTGVSVRVLTPDNVSDKFGDEDYHLIRVDASRLEEYRVAMKLRDKGSAFLRLVQPSRPKIMLINPDLLYLLFSLKYGRASAEIATHFQAYRTVVFDEFHLYSGVELAHVLFLIHLARQFGGFSRVVLLSATPSSEVLCLLDRLLDNPLLLGSEVKTSHPDVEERIVTFPVTLEYVGRGSESAEAAFSCLQHRRDELKAARRANSSEEYVPAVIILNSVVSAIRLEDLLMKAGWDRMEIGVVRGLMAKEQRQIIGRAVVIGTSAIEVGIDFQTDLLLFEAGDAASFLQRIGRVGRHGPGMAILLGDSREEAAFRSLPDEVSRDELELAIQRIYKGRDSFAWFPGTFSGALTMIAQAESIRRHVDEDRTGMEAARKEIGVWLDRVIDGFGVKMGWEKHTVAARKRVVRARQGGSIGKWIANYIDGARFRSSIPTVQVYDWAEAGRGRSAEYEADLITLLKWANCSPRYREKNDMVYIDGIRAGNPHKLHLSASFEDEEVGVILPVTDYSSLRVMQDNHLTSISHVLTLRPHVIVLIPLDFARKLDWRLPWLRCGSQGNKAAVLDGAALIVWEMWKREQEE